MDSQVWPIHHSFQAPGGLTRSFTSRGGGAEARSARPGAEGFGILVEPWKVRIRHQPKWVWKFCTHTGKVGFGEQFLECHAYCMDSMLNSEVEALKEEVLGALELFSFRFTNWENHLDHLPRGFTPSEPTAFRSQGTARAGATTSWGREARWCRGIVTLGAEHDTNYIQLSPVLGHTKNANVFLSHRMLAYFLYDFWELLTKLTKTLWRWIHEVFLQKTLVDHWRYTCFR